jgi:hypothetical protein
LYSSSSSSSHFLPRLAFVLMTACNLPPDVLRVGREDSDLRDFLVGRSSFVGEGAETRRLRGELGFLVGEESEARALVEHCNFFGDGDSVDLVRNFCFEGGAFFQNLFTAATAFLKVKSVSLMRRRRSIVDELCVFFEDPRVLVLVVTLCVRLQQV